jgi:L-gulono-1,4-lactone dehydrogenase
MWENWSRTARCVPAAFERPRSRAEVAQAVERAAAARRTLRVAGAGHSFAPAVPTDGTLLSLERMDRVLDADSAAGLVRVEAGISLHRLSRELMSRGLALPNLGDIDVQSLAGAIATGTHGTGARLPNLSAQIEALELVLADGGERTLTAADGDLLRAARVGLGALGVVVAATLRCVPAFRLHGVDRPEPLEDVLASLDERAAAADHFELWSFPHSPIAITRTNRRTDAPRATPGRARAWVEDVAVENHVLALLNRAGRRRPGLTPRINRLIPRLARPRERVDWSFLVFASPRLFRFTEMEYAVPREHAVAALHGARAILERFTVSMPVELRLVAGDDALLSPAHARDSAYVAVHVFEGLPWEAPFREFEALMRGFGGRPHWGKWSFLTADELAPRYPAWDAFQAARAELDPDGRFENDWVRRVLGQRKQAPSPR